MSNMFVDAAVCPAIDPNTLEIGAVAMVIDPWVTPKMK